MLLSVSHDIDATVKIWHFFTGPSVHTSHVKHEKYVHFLSVFSEILFPFLLKMPIDVNLCLRISFPISYELKVSVAFPYEYIIIIIIILLRAAHVSKASTSAALQRACVWSFLDLFKVSDLFVLLAFLPVSNRRAGFAESSREKPNQSSLGHLRFQR